MRSLWSRITALFRRRRLDGELNDELAFHLAMLEDEYRARGMTAVEARNAAHREFGGVAQTQERYRDRRGFPWIDNTIKDLRYALRGLRRNPGFSAAVVLTLALVTGANTAVFSLFYPLMMRALPVARPQELLWLRQTNGHSGPVSYPLFREIAARADLFHGALATTRVGIDESGVRERGLRQEYVSGSYFSVLGVPPALGRLFTEADDRARIPVVVLSYDYWQRRFGGDPRVLGRMIGECTVIGVAGPVFSGVSVDRHADAWFPAAMHGQLDEPGTGWVQIVARRRPEVPLKQIQAALDVLVARHYDRLTADFDAVSRKTMMAWRLEARDGRLGLSTVREQFGRPLAILLATVGVLLLAACANLAGLLLARAIARRRETALRLALGAGRWRLMRQSLSESLALTVAGCGLGGLFALWGRRYVLHFLPSGAGNPFDSPDRAVFAFILAVLVFSMALFGAAPALYSAAADPAVGLRREISLISGRTGSLRKWLVVAQVAFSAVLVGMAALFGSSLAQLRRTGMGFPNRNAVVLGASFHGAGGAAASFLARLKALPGVTSVSTGSAPFLMGMSTSSVRVSGSERTAAGPARVLLRRAAEGYFGTLGLPVLSGRDFDRSDSANGRETAIVNQAFLREFMPGERNPTARTFSFDAANPAGRKPIPIIGIVPDIPHQGLRDAVEPTIYLSTQPAAGPFIVVSSARPPAEVIAALRREFANSAHRVFSEPQTIGKRIDESVFQDRILAALSGFFGGLALLLSAVGLYGVMAFEMTSRTGEIGIRIALGAQRRTVLWLALREAAMLVALGLAVGLPAAYAAARAAGALVFGVKATDGWLFVSTSMALLATGLAASFVPARRAAAMDPMRALRSD